MEDAAAGLMVLAFLALGVGGLVFWVVALLDCVRRPENDYRAAGTEKVTWVLIVVLAGWLGGLVYWFSQRSRLVEIERSGAGRYAPAWGAPHPGYVAPPMPPSSTPPGWYPDPQGAGLRWWDGVRWTEHISDRPAT